MERVKLGSVVKIQQARATQEESVWLLNLDMVEQQTGKVIRKVRTNRNSVGNSTILFDESNVLYSKLRPNLNKVVLPDECGYATSELLPFRPDPVRLDRRYLAAYLRSAGFVELMCSKAAGAKMPRVSTETVLQTVIPLPSLDDQRKIAAQFEQIAALTDAKRAQLATLDQLVKSRFVELFGEYNEVVPISFYIKELIAGKSLASEEECSNKVLKTGAATYDYFDPTQVKNLPPDYAPMPEHRLKFGDVIISRMNTLELVGAAAFVWEAPENTYLPDRLWKVVLNGDCNPIFLWQCLIQPATKEQIRKIAGGTSGSMKNISKQGLLGIQVKKIPYPLQNQFSDYVKRTDTAKSAIRAAIVRLETLKNSLMQRYFALA